MGYARLHVVNLFAWMSTDPVGYARRPILWAPQQRLHRCGGRRSQHHHRGVGRRPASTQDGHPVSPAPLPGREVVERITASIADPCHDLHCLAQNADGSPHHPLYLSTSVTPVLYRAKVPR